MKTAYGYGRFSTDRQREESIEAQEIAIRNFCKQNNISLIAFYADRGLSGTNDNREQFQNMLDDADKGGVDYVIVHKLDRFARNRYDSVIVRKRLADHGVKLLSVLERVNDDSPEDIILLSVLEGMSEYYSKNLSREVKKGMYRNVEKGIYNGGFLPYGYKVNVNNETHFVEIDENEAAIVREIYSLYLENNGYVTIANKLNERGLKTKRGNIWTADTIGKLLKNEKYKGTYFHGKTKVIKNGRRQKVIKNKDWKQEETYPVIIDAEIWEAAKRRRTMNKPKGGKKHEYLLVGYAKCKKCGANYIGSSSAPYNDHVYRFYTCSRHNRKKCDAKIINADMLETIVIDFIKEKFFESESLDQYINDCIKLLNTDINNDDKIEAINKEIKSCTKKLDRLVELYIDDNISQEKYCDKKNELDCRVKSLEHELNLITIDRPVISKKEVKKIVNNFIKNMDDSFKYKKMLIDTFLDSVTIDDETFEITLIYNLFSKTEKIICNIDNASPYSSKKAFTASPPLQIN
ncbi:recombinase family protein [Dielma fastidiosa]|uniref:recombinase family protein n=1 Tax=Dielma fastidiosa TaxID=1034346 RepID=UPI000E4AF564|nr:recombinase family protein [Dielma fastidiosa]RHM97145.1 recombinase family protein [Dielma fastidiosa]